MKIKKINKEKYPEKPLSKEGWMIIFFILGILILCIIIEPLRPIAETIVGIPFVLGLIFLWSIPIIFFVIVVMALIKYLQSKK